MLIKQPYTNFTLGLMALVLLTSFTLSAVVRSTALPQEPEAHEGHDQDSPLAHAMSKLKDNMRGLRKTLGKPDKTEDGMAFATGMRHAALEALPLWPDAPQGLSKSEQVKWRVDFQRKLLAVCDGTLQIELALAEERPEDAKAVYKTLLGIKKEGHDTYDPDEE
ncbi:MAG: hypothetical protein QM477_02925 [Planctomycetota bacterium]